ncbi:MAG: chemotaxis protein CheW [Gemmatimonadota bacterium]
MSGAPRFDSAFRARCDAPEAPAASLASTPGANEGLLVAGARGPVLLPLGAVRELVPGSTLAPLPGAPRELLGLAAVRGEVLPVLSLAPCAVPESHSGCLAVVEAAGVRFALALEEVPRTVRAGPAGGRAGETSAGSSTAAEMLDLAALARRVFDTETAESGMPHDSPGEES